MKYQYVVGRVLDLFPEMDPDTVVSRLRYSSFVSLSKRYMYFEVPKAACTQIKGLLRIIENAPPITLFPDGFWETRRDMFIHARCNVPLPSLVDLDSRAQKDVLESPDFLRMTVVRNPYTRLASAWRSKVLLCEPMVRDVYLQIKGRLPDLYDKASISFEEFVEYVTGRCDLRTCNSHWRRQVDLIFFPALNFSHIGKVERLGETLRRLELHLGLSNSLAAEGRNVSAAVGAAVYNAELADRVYSQYQKDFDVFGYDRDTWATSREGRVGRGATVPQEKFLDEIIERNLIILGLYEERKRLQAQFHRVSRLHLLSVVNGLAKCKLASGKLAREMARRAHRMFRTSVAEQRGSSPST